MVTKRCLSGLKPSEVQLLLQVAGQSRHGHAKRNYALLHLMLQTGLRVNEVTELKLSDIDIMERSGMVRVRLGKGRKARDIPLNTRVRRALKLYLSCRNDTAKTDRVFLSERLTPLSTRSIQAVITELAKRAKINRIKISPHTLRHTFAINYLKQNLLTKTADMDIVEEQWESMLRVVISLKKRTSPAHVVVQRLTSSGPSDRLTKAFINLGRIIKTEYILRYLTDSELRHTVQSQLNKGEYRHRIPRWIFFANQGEFTVGD